MGQHKTAASGIRSYLCKGLSVLVALLVVSIPARSQEKPSPAIIQATARGTSTQLGKIFQVRINIYEYSTDEDRKILIEAFQKGKNQGLVNALEKMKAVGHISIEGTLGYDLSFIRMIPTPAGRTIRFVTNREIRFAENYYDSRTLDYNLTAGEISLNDQDQSKSTGTLFPLAKLKLDKENQLSLELNQNPWQLVNIMWSR